MDRIEHQEWALKGIDPKAGPALVLNPSPSHSPSSSSESDAGAASGSGTGIATSATLPLLYPPTLLHPSSLLLSLTRLTTQRTPYHRTRLLYCLVGMPLTIPFALVPVVPNLPFFYLVWRAYSHWRAWKGAEYLRGLLEQGRVEGRASQEIERAMLLGGEGVEGIDAAGGGAQILLTEQGIERLQSGLGLDEQARLELRRALQQTRLAGEKGELEDILAMEEKAASVVGGEGGQGGGEEKKDR